MVWWDMLEETRNFDESYISIFLHVRVELDIYLSGNALL